MHNEVTDDFYFLLAATSEVFGPRFRRNMGDWPTPNSGRPQMLLELRHTDWGYWMELISSKFISGVIEGGLQHINQKKCFVDSWRKKVSELAAEHCLMVKRHDAHIVLRHHSSFPPLLRVICDSPHALTCLGDIERLQDPLISVVGSRKASKLALTESFRTGQKLAQKGITIVSGGAFGCDVAVHEGVFSSGTDPCRAIIVLAGGLGSLYPKAHEGFFLDIVRRQGCLVSERLWGTKPYRSDFPVRNRIIAGMTGLLLLMQAGDTSGAMVTARLSLEYGSDVAVLIHPPDDARAVGNKKLIDQGAFPFLKIEDLLPSLSGWRESEVGFFYQ